MKYGERLLQARKHAGLSQAILAEKSGTTQANVSALEKGDATGSEFTVQFADACGINHIWLATGKGEMDAGLYITDRKLIKACEMMEPFKEYEKDIAIKEIVEIVEHIAEIHDKKK